MSYQHCTRFRTILDFDREYLWNGSSNRQAKNGVSNYDFSTLFKKQFVNFGPLTRKNDLDLWLMILKFNRVRAAVKVHVCIKYHQDECCGSWVIVLTNKFKKTPTKTIQSVATVRTAINEWRFSWSAAHLDRTRPFMHSSWNLWNMKLVLTINQQVRPGNLENLQHKKSV